jgi:acyl-coenzyme A thioesterase PaaI-like protein
MLRKLAPARPRLRLRELLYTYYPAYFGTGARIDHIAPNHREIGIKIPHSWRTTNTHGTIFGGSIYGAVDPIHAMMLMERLGDGYRAWVKAGDVEFLNPARSTLSATVTLADDEIEEIEGVLEEQSSVDRTYSVDLQDEEGTICATVETTIHITRREKA